MSSGGGLGFRASFKAVLPHPLAKKQGARSVTLARALKWLHLKLFFESTSNRTTNSMQNKSGSLHIARHSSSNTTIPWVLPPLSDSWMMNIVWLDIAVNRTPNIDCYWVGAVPKLYLKPPCTGLQKPHRYPFCGTKPFRISTTAILGTTQTLHPQARTLRPTPQTLSPKP